MIPPFFATNYYKSLIDWNDPNDPLRRIVEPRHEDLNWGSSDTNNEASDTIVPGLQRKYRDTALLLVSKACASYCRYCFRKRLFSSENVEASSDVSEGISYIRQNKQINNVLLTGGDPLTLATKQLLSIIRQLNEIPHVRVVRIGSKCPAFRPMRIYEDQELLDSLSELSNGKQQICMVAHFDHPREITDKSTRAIVALRRAGLTCVNQCPIIRGVNDKSSTLAKLFEELTYIGCMPYYVFQCRPVIGNREFVLPLVEAFEIFRNAVASGSGLARTARFVMSHEKGKIEIVHVDQHSILCRFHQASLESDNGRTIAFHRNDKAIWLDELTPIVASPPLFLPTSPMLLAPEVNNA